MDRLLRRTSITGGWLALAILALPACSDNSSPQHALQAVSSTPNKVGTNALDRQPAPSPPRLVTGRVIPVAHLFSPPPVPDAEQPPILLQPPTDQGPAPGPTVRLAPTLDEPRRLPPLPRRLPAVGGPESPAMDDAIVEEPVDDSAAPSDARLNPADEIRRLPQVSTEAQDELRRLPAAADTPDAMHRLPAVATNDESLIRRLPPPPEFDEPTPMEPPTEESSSEVDNYGAGDTSHGRDLDTPIPVGSLTDRDADNDTATENSTNPDSTMAEAADQATDEPANVVTPPQTLGEAPVPIEKPVFDAEAPSTSAMEQAPAEPDPDCRRLPDPRQESLEPTASQDQSDQIRRLPPVEDRGNEDASPIQLSAPTPVDESPWPVEDEEDPARLEGAAEDTSGADEILDPDAAGPQAKKGTLPHLVRSRWSLTDMHAGRTHVTTQDPNAAAYDRQSEFPLDPNAAISKSQDAATPSWQPVTVPMQPEQVQPPTPAPAKATVTDVIRRRVDGMMATAESLAARGAYYAARAELIKALRLISQALDTQQGGGEHSAALARAMRAFQEAEDFSPPGSQLEAELNLPMLVGGHRTPVLKDNLTPGVTPLAAQQRYLTYAQDQLAEAFAHEPVASRALYGLARVYGVLDRAKLDSQTMNIPKAVVLHQAALLVDPANSQSANELGVLLARFGQLEDARCVLLRAVSTHPGPESWHNLAVVHQRLGEDELAKRAFHESELTVQTGSAPPDNQGVEQVRWVDPQTFATAQPVPAP